MSFVFYTITMSAPNTFTVPLGGQSPSDLLDRAKNAAASSGAIFVGNTSDGVFHNDQVAGSYHVSGNNVYVTITIKPWYAPWSMVISKIKGFFETTSTKYKVAYEDMGNQGGGQN
jgi:hypothetical protein